jgi:multidrug resistance protein, MATE family
MSSTTPRPQSEPFPGEDADETSQLLPKSDNGLDEEQRPAARGIHGLEERGKLAAKHVFREFTDLLKASLPVFLAYALQNSLQTISVIIVGRGPPEDLATAAFAYMFAMCTAWLIALGGTTALDTLGSSTFTGSNDPCDLGILLQRAFIVLTLFYIPVVILWIFSEPVFRFLGQSPQLSRDSAKFLQCLAPGGIGYIYFECMKKYLQAQGLMILADVFQERH